LKLLMVIMRGMRDMFTPMNMACSNLSIEEYSLIGTLIYLRTGDS